MRAWVLCLVFCAVAQAAFGGGLRFAGQTGSNYNDWTGDGHDRWRTGGYLGSVFFEDGPTSWEVRARVDLITPWDGAPAGAPDRPAAAYWGLGAFRYDRSGAVTTKVGAELIGLDSGIFSLQRDLHALFPGNNLYDHSDDTYTLPDGYRPTLQGEISRDIQVSAGVLRPFAEFEAGFENFVRVGADFTTGPGFSRHTTRIPATGFVLPPKGQGFSRPGSGGIRLYAGGDITRDLGSRLYDGGEVDAKRYRTRLRAGIMAGRDQLSVFYGVTRLGREFGGQPEPQWLGTISLSLRF